MKKDFLDLTAGTWEYMPGATRTKDGLSIQDVDMKIVQQDGSGGQANPPVNEYGAHLETDSNYQLSYKVSRIKGAAAFRIYERPPIIQDEFRIEPASIELSAKIGSFVINIWDGYSQGLDLNNQKPSSVKQYKIPHADNYEVVLVQDGKNTEVKVNGQQIAELKDVKALESSQLWLGAHSTDGSYLLSEIHAKGLNGKTVKSIDTSKLSMNKQDENGLQVLAKKKRSGFLVGAAMALAPMVSDSEYANIALSGNFGSVTTENALKWQFVEPKQNLFSYGEAEALVVLAQKHGLAIHGHTLVFGEANPSWVNKLPTSSADQKANVKKVMLNHINNLVAHFKGRIGSWDVVNEPLNDENEIRNHIWYKAMGKDYIKLAFNEASKSDPSAKLFINEYGLEEDGERWDSFLQLVKDLKTQKVPIYGVGFQSHVYERADKINPTVLKKHIKVLGDIGLKVRISEMDVYTDDGANVQAQQYADVFEACINEPNCISWTSWGVSDRYDMWQDDNHKLQYGSDFLWDKNMKPTPAVKKIQQLLSN